ncbi:DUF4262 domain-containing protein [Sciscionella marina]|uniref:DUF4262 domain-containing protein n=1 Tax=Sciscionella marina TaxID=508770 RepID=UPI00047698DE|nr:DUF4262 domain-containing protein [Sciscionella marina]
MCAVTTLPLSEEDTALRRWMLAQAEEHGCALIQVDEDDTGSGYTFSAGAWRRYGVPEAVVVGLDPEMAAELIHRYVHRAAAGERFVPGGLYGDFFEGVSLTVERVAPSWYPEYLGSAFLLYSNGDFPALQIIVPTSEGYWPWSLDAPAGFAAWQPVLTESGKPESWRPGHDGP